MAQSTNGKAITLGQLPQLFKRINAFIVKVVNDSLMPILGRLEKVERSMAGYEKIDIDQKIENALNARMALLPVIDEEAAIAAARAKRDTKRAAARDVIPPSTFPLTATETTEELETQRRNAIIDQVSQEIGYRPSRDQRNFMLEWKRNFTVVNVQRNLETAKAANQIFDACSARNVTAKGANRLARLILDNRASANQIADDIKSSMTIDAILEKYGEEKPAAPESNPDFAQARQQAIDLATAAGYTPEVGGEAYWQQIHDGAQLLLPFVGKSTPDSQGATDEVKRRYEGLVDNINALKED